MNNNNATTSSIAAPEDVRPGQFVAVLHEVEEYVPLTWLDEISPEKLTPVRVLLLPCADLEPLKVVEVSLPFVQAQRACGCLRMLDVRRHQLALLSDHAGSNMFNRLKVMHKRRREKEKAERS